MGQRPRYGARSLAGVAAALLALIARGTQARDLDAEQRPRRVMVNCGQLSAEACASVEARLSGELIVSGMEARLNLTCSESEVAGEIELNGQSLRDARELEPAVSEELLALGMDLIDRISGRSDEEPTGDPVPNEEETVAAKQMTMGSFSVPVEDKAQVDTRPHGTTFGIRVGAATVYQHWGSQVTGALGPHFDGLFLLGLRPAGLSLELEPTFALQARQGYRLMDVRGQLTGFTRIFPWLSLGGGALFSVMKVTGPSEVEARKSSSIRPGILGYVEGLLQARRSEAYLRLSVSALPATRSIEQDGTQVISVPRVQFLICIGVRVAVLQH